eukprot:11746112-Alexandrium_andersonii.AAC.1
MHQWLAERSKWHLVLAASTTLHSRAAANVRQLTTPTALDRIILPKTALNCLKLHNAGLCGITQLWAALGAI